MPAHAQAPSPAAASAPEAPSAPTAMAVPAMAGPLVANPNPMSFDGGPLGKVYFTGAISGIGLFQSDPGSANQRPPQPRRFEQRPDPAAEHRRVVSVFRSGRRLLVPGARRAVFACPEGDRRIFGPLPVAYAKLAPSDTFSIQAGKLPTLIGAEYSFTHQNMNIERGLLWNQEPIVSRGVQANLTLGALALSASLNDGFYSDSYNWLTGSAAWTIDKQNTLTVVGGGNFDKTNKNVVSEIAAAL